MPTAAALITDVRSRVVEPTTRFFTDAEVLRWLNQGYHDYTGRAEWCEKITAFAITASVPEVTIPTDVNFIQQVMWQDKWPVRNRDLEEFMRFVGVANTTTSDRALIYRIHPWDGKMRLFPIPSVASKATTLTGAHNNSVTTLTVGSTTGFDSTGWLILNDSEQVRYFGTTATTFINCVRGDGFTTAGTYVGAESVKEGKLQVYMTYDPPDLASGDTPRIANDGTEALILYATAIAMEKKDKFTNAQLLHKQYEAMVLRGAEARRMEQRDRYHCIKDDESEFFQ